MNILNLAKKSAKEIFKLIRKNRGVFCPALQFEVKITRRFLQHICFNQDKDRSAEEIMERILIMPFVSHIIEKGEYISKREEYGKTFIRISYVFWTAVKLSIILEKTQKHCIVLSCFRNTKKDLSLPAVLPHHR